jgi:uncharacterized membrane protein
MYLTPHTFLYQTLSGIFLLLVLLGVVDLPLQDGILKY